MIVFYVLVIYILASFVWWSVLHVRKNEQIFNDKIKILQFEYERAGLDPANIKSSDSFLAMQEKQKKQNLMIMGEGLVFLLLLGMGIYRIQSGFNKEIQLNRQQRNFLLSITHELKSPLAGIKLALQTIFKHELPREQNLKLLSNSLNDTDRLQNLVDNLLMAAKLENQNITFAKEEQNLSNLLSNIATKFSGDLNLKRQFSAEIGADLITKGDRTALNSVFINLIENAIKYSVKDDKIGITAKKVNDQILVYICDTGIGISDTEKKKVFKKFYRVGNEDTRKTKGTGLGLFIVKELVEFHGGQISIKNNKPKGTIFKIVFPASKVVQEVVLRRVRA